MKSHTLTIIFDFFGVIRADGGMAWLKENGFELSGEFRKADGLRCAGKITEQEYLDVFSRLSGQDPEKINQRMHELAVIDNQMVELLQKLHQKYRMVLITNSSETTRPYIEANGINKYFDEMFLSNEIGLIKPDARFYKYVLDKLDIPAQEACFIDDKPENTNAAKKLGMRIIDFTSYNQLLNELEQNGVTLEWVSRSI
ncbi:MAG: HAD family phosphatase [Candidatus Nomurabacteria bacterium]|nr:HAD family phosphatase [Candidatus Nomurabacteria bacterium]